MTPHKAGVVYVEPLLGNLKREIFEEAGWDVSLHRFRNDLQQVIEGLKEDEADLVVMDYFFRNERAARALLGAMHEDKTMTDVPILVCRDREQSDVILRGTSKDHLLATLERPYTVEAFMAKVDQLLRLSEEKRTSPPAPGSSANE